MPRSLATGGGWYIYCLLERDPMTTTRYIVSRRAALGIAAAPVLGGPFPARSQPRLDKLSFVTNWRAQAEHGGFYQAQAAGLYRAAGLDVTLTSGGPQINPAQLLLIPSKPIAATDWYCP
jgi:NitT/TauT family transport system substrate-binding protein